MSRQLQVVGGGQRSIVGRLVMLLLMVGLLVWFIKSPVEAATAVKGVFHWFSGAVDAVVTFFDHVLG